MRMLETRTNCAFSLIYRYIHVKSSHHDPDVNRDSKSCLKTTPKHVDLSLPLLGEITVSSAVFCPSKDFSFSNTRDAREYVHSSPRRILLCTPLNWLKSTPGARPSVCSRFLRFSSWTLSISVKTSSTPPPPAFPSLINPRSS